MPPTTTPQPAPATRLTYPADPKLNAIIQDIYNKLAQIQAQVNRLPNP